jgi:2,5-dihydroxypyridine 5,6-dioxygenase
MGILRWGDWGEAVVRMLVEVKPGENLLILADTWTYMDAAEACLIAGINAKANAQLLVLPRMLDTDTREFKSAAGAIMGADAIVALGGMSNLNVRDVSFKAREKGTRIASCHVRSAGDWAIVGVLDADYPRMVKVAEKICELWEKTQVCKLTSAVGTDVSFQLRGRPCDLGDGRAVGPGEIDYFPGVTPSIAPVEKTVNGTIVVDGSISDPDRMVSAPVTLRLEKGVITAIEGGADADALRSRLESPGEPEAFHMAHFNIGINPAAKLGSSMGQDEMVVGVVTFGFGHQDPDFQGTVGPCTIHTDVTLRSPTVYLDGVVMCENNKLNPDLGLGGL